MSRESLEEDMAGRLPGCLGALALDGDAGELVGRGLHSRLARKLLLAYLAFKRFEILLACA